MEEVRKRVVEFGDKWVRGIGERVVIATTPSVLSDCFPLRKVLKGVRASGEPPGAPGLSREKQGCALSRRYVQGLAEGKPESCSSRRSISFLPRCTMLTNSSFMGPRAFQRFMTSSHEQAPSSISQCLALASKCMGKGQSITYFFCSSS